MDVDTARALLRAMGDEEGVALECPDRVALQVRLRAPDPLAALKAVFTRWREAVRTVGPQGWTVVRVEILTEGEFDRDVDAGLW